MNNDLLRQAESIQVRRRNKKAWKRIVCALSCVVAFCTTYALILPAITMEHKSTYCGINEHIHNDSCYEIRLVCPCGEEHAQTEACSTEENSLACKTEESECHVHTEECYEHVLTCTKEEHTHEIMCYSDPDADVESQAVWESTLDCAKLTGVWMEDILSVAGTQMGYHESEKNYIADEEGALHGYTRYGDWYGSPYGDWCAMFASFCLNYANVPEAFIPRESSCQNWCELFITMNLWRDGGYLPSPGDIIFFDFNGDGVSSHVGIVQHVNVEENTIFTIEGNRSNAVAACEYNLDSGNILGYCDITSAYSAYCNITPEETGESGEKEEPAALAEQQLAAAIYTDSTYTDQLEDITVITISGALPENAVIKAYPVCPQNGELAEASLICAYDITIFTAEGEVFQPADDAPLTVAFSLPQEPCAEESIKDYSEDELITEIVTVCAAHISEEGELEQLVPTVEGNTVSFTADHFSAFVVYKIINRSEIIPGESVEDDSAFRSLEESGYFTYWEQFLTGEESSEPALNGIFANTFALDDKISSSDSQIKSPGGTNTSTYDDGVTVSKIIAGTDIENVFDITLKVITSVNISEFYREPDMAVVIVMDISNSMKDAFGDTTRYAAAMTAAEQFIDELAATSNGVSKVGFVAFNTDSHEIFGLSPCSTTAQATLLKNDMRTKTGAIINRGTTSDGKDVYSQSHDRFTNIEAGLKRGSDMLASATNENKYIIFLSDGFPTTYIKTGYNGYDPYTSSGTVGSDGVFHDDVDNTYCSYGTSYSDKAAKRAQSMAAEIKGNGIQIFTIGVDVGGQTIKNYDTHRGHSFSVIDRTSETYAIGGADDPTGYTNWLKYEIGSGYYYPSTNLSELQNAYTQIFDRIKEIHEEGSSAQWVANDPMGTIPGENIEFIGFYDKNGSFVPNYGSLTGSWAENAENTASVDGAHSVISWDLKTSGYTTTTDGGTAMYNYCITYRVRLENELSGFIENTDYNTNNTTTLTYKTFTSISGNITFSEQRSIEFPTPMVEGYLGELTFKKQGTTGNLISGAEFTLTHDTENCSICRGNGTAVAIGDMTAISGENGTVTFTGIPSGHTYIMEETVVPAGYWSNGNTYSVTVAYDVVTVTVTNSDGTAGIWDGTVVNVTQYTLPDTGGVGTAPYTAAGVSLIVFSALFYGYCNRRKRKRRTE
ncbi:MAG: SpaA isopeptide-forming pilin-related protein [Firmicutes bacterium]|nr:SpaA isopeptide-forming pilin-related protein [Bacillota bacterium]